MTHHCSCFTGEILKTRSNSRDKAAPAYEGRAEMAARFYYCLLGQSQDGFPTITALCQPVLCVFLIQYNMTASVSQRAVVPTNQLITQLLLLMRAKPTWLPYYKSFMPASVMCAPNTI